MSSVRDSDRPRAGKPASTAREAGDTAAAPHDVAPPPATSGSGDAASPWWSAPSGRPVDIPSLARQLCVEACIDALAAWRGRTAGPLVPEPAH